MMTVKKPIYLIAKELGIESDQIILACKSLGIEARASSKRLSDKEFEKIQDYFANGKNVANEIVDLINPEQEVQSNTKSNINIQMKLKVNKNNFFPNRLTG